MSTHRTRETSCSCGTVTDAQNIIMPLSHPHYIHMPIPCCWSDTRKQPSNYICPRRVQCGVRKGRHIRERILWHGVSFPAMDPNKTPTPANSGGSCHGAFSPCPMCVPVLLLSKPVRRLLLRQAHPSKAMHYVTLGQPLLLCRIALGEPHMTKSLQTDRTKAPDYCDSVVGCADVSRHALIFTATSLLWKCAHRFEQSHRPRCPLPARRYGRPNDTTCLTDTNEFVVYNQDLINPEYLVYFKHRPSCQCGQTRFHA